MKTKIAFILLVLVLLGCAFALSPAPAVAYDSCDLAAAAGFHHPGLNGWCITEILIDLIFEGADPSILYG